MIGVFLFLLVRSTHRRRAPAVPVRRGADVHLLGHERVRSVRVQPRPGGALLVGCGPPAGHRGRGALGPGHAAAIPGAAVARPAAASPVPRAGTRRWARVVAVARGRRDLLQHQRAQSVPADRRWAGRSRPPTSGSTAPLKELPRPRLVAATVRADLEPERGRVHRQRHLHLRQQDHAARSTRVVVHDVAPEDPARYAGVGPPRDGWCTTTARWGPGFSGSTRCWRRATPCGSAIARAGSSTASGTADRRPCVAANGTFVNSEYYPRPRIPGRQRDLVGGGPEEGEAAAEGADAVDRR